MSTTVVKFDNMNDALAAVAQEHEGLELNISDVGAAFAYHTLLSYRREAGVPRTPGAVWQWLIKRADSVEHKDGANRYRFGAVQIIAGKKITIHLLAEPEPKYAFDPNNPFDAPSRTPLLDQTMEMVKRGEPIDSGTDFNVAMEHLRNQEQDELQTVEVNGATVDADTGEILDETEPGWDHPVFYLTHMDHVWAARAPLLDYEGVLPFPEKTQLVNIYVHQDGVITFSADRSYGMLVNKHIYGQMMMQVKDELNVDADQDIRVPTQDGRGYWVLEPYVLADCGVSGVVQVIHNAYDTYGYSTMFNIYWVRNGWERRA